MTQQKQWWKETVVYQVYPRSFQDSNGDGIGDLNGITSRLDYLKDLGVDVIWISPVYASPMVDGGYDICDYRAIHKDFGTMEDFDRLLAEAHKRDLKVLMDLVVNHTSSQHPWFLESKSSRDNPKRDWYIWRDGYEDGPPNQMPSIFSGPAWELDEATGQYYLHLFAVEQPDLNWENPQVREAVHDMMRFWLDKGVDGFRMDAVTLISKPAAAVAADGGPPVRVSGGPHIHDYFREMNEKVISHYQAMTVAEASFVTLEEARDYAGFDRGEVDMVFHFEMVELGQHGPCGKFVTDRPTMPEIREVLSRWQVGLNGVAWNSLYWSNHDQPRSVSRFGDTSSRLFWEKSAKLLATCTHMMQGTPYIYQGEELGMTNTIFNTLDDVDDVETHNAYRALVVEQGVYTHEEMMACIRYITRDNARTPMQWSDGPNGGFTTGKPWLAANPNYLEVNAESQVEDPGSIFSYYKALVKLRREHPIIVYGDYMLLCPEHPWIFAYQREYEGKKLVVLCNFSDKIQENPLAAQVSAGTVLIGNYPGSNGLSRLQPYEAVAVML